MKFCEHYPLVAFAVVSRSRALFTRLRCGSWSCEYCARKNRDIWRAHLIDRLPEISDNWWSVTLTARETTRTTKSSLANIRTRIDRLFKRLRRIYKDVQYVRVYEKHPTSVAIHAHLIVARLSPFLTWRRARSGSTQFIPLDIRTEHKGTWTIKTFMKRTCRDLGMGYQVDCKRIEDARRSVGYVTKYLTKALQEIHVKGLRHVQTSRKIGSPKNEGNYAWQVRSFVTARDFAPGTDVIDLQTGELIPDDYFERFDYYPPEMS